MRWIATVAALAMLTTGCGDDSTPTSSPSGGVIGAGPMQSGGHPWEYDDPPVWPGFLRETWTNAEDVIGFLVDAGASVTVIGAHTGFSQSADGQGRDLVVFYVNGEWPDPEIQVDDTGTN